jgi:tetratricopeptide (TPR) repeat protein
VGAGRSPDVPPHADLVLEAELLSESPTLPPEEATVAERLARARRARARGNALFRRQEEGGALTAYSRGLKLLAPPPMEDDATATTTALAEVEEERTQLLCNQALCLWRAGDLPAASAACDLCLATHPQHQKALYRAAAVRAAMGETDIALGHVRALLALAPGHADGLALQRQILAQRSAQRATDRALYGRMLAREHAGLYDDMPVAPGAADAVTQAEAANAVMTTAMAKGGAGWTAWLWEHRSWVLAWTTVLAAIVWVYVIVPATVPSHP